jgi:hypothetical protein
VAKKNAFLDKLQTQAATRELMSTAQGIGQTKQGMVDAIIMTAGYGDCMKNDKWGEGRIMAFIEECLENYQTKVFPGIEIRDDADGFRKKTDELIAKKCPKYFAQQGPWPERYPFWKELSLEQEAARSRRVNKKKKKRK